MRFKCDQCGEEHDLEDISFGMEAPQQWGCLSDSDRSRSILGREQCEIISAEGCSYYIRACLEIPVKGTDRDFVWEVWCSLSESSYTEMTEHWDDPGRVALGPYFGWLCTRIPEYPDTVFLKTLVHQREIGVRPSVELEATNHPLAIDQSHGMDQARWREIVTKLLHHTNPQEPPLNSDP
jgi:hypothetical protein